jgi:WD40 repeat protein
VWRPTAAASARFITNDEHGRALWAVGPMLGTLSLETGQNGLVVTLPRNEEVACAAWSADGSLLAAASKQSSLSLWAADGSLLTDWPGSQRPEASCGSYVFALAPATKRAVAALGYRSAALFGPGLATTLRHAEQTGVVSSSFSPDGRRAFAQIASERVGIYDATSGKQLGELPGVGLPRFSSTGKYFTLSVQERKAALYATDSLRALNPNTPETPETLELLQLFDAWDGPAYDDSGAFRVGATDSGYGVFEVPSNRQLASWRGSGLGCGYEWAWHEGKLVFIEGTLLTFWSKASGAHTVASECQGALTPIFTKDRSRVIALDGIWNATTHELVAQLEMTSGGDVWGFSRDERLVLGSVALAASPNGPVSVGWDVGTGRIAWQAQPLLGVEPTGAWPFIDERNGKDYWLTNVVDPERGLTPLIFDAACWDGPSKLPAMGPLPPNPARRHCPGLLAELQRMMRSRGLAVPVRN